MADSYFFVGIRTSESEDSIIKEIRLSSKPDFKEEKASPEPAQEPEGEPVMNFGSVQASFFNQMLAFLDILPGTVHLVPALRSAWMADFEKKNLEKHATDTLLDSDWKIYKLPSIQRGTISRAFQKSRVTSDAFGILPQLMLLGLVSQFDAYMGSLLRIAITHRPDIISKSQKSFPAYEVLQYPDLESFKNAVIDKEVEGFLRKSHEDQFSWLESSFDIKTNDGVESWPEFVEACERRNLFAHSNGVVSEQYRIKCLAAGAAVEARKGEKVGVSPAYLKRKVGVFLEIGIKIAQVICRKLDGCQENLVIMDRRLNDFAFELISHEHYEEAKRLLDFGHNVLKKHPDATIKNMMVVNRANAYKLSGEADEAFRILDGIDWSPFDPIFRISVAAIKDDVNMVIEIMPQLAGRQDFPSSNYRDWPVFSKVRENEAFLAAFERLYGQAFTIRAEGSLDQNSREEMERPGPAEGDLESAFH